MSRYIKSKRCESLEEAIEMIRAAHAIGLLFKIESVYAYTESMSYKTESFEVDLYNREGE